MSSILDALKKVERHEADQDRQAGGIADIGPGNPSIRDLKRSNAMRNGALAVLGIFALTAFGWYIYVRPPGTFQVMASLPLLIRGEKGLSSGGGDPPEAVDKQPAPARDRPSLKTIPPMADPLGHSRGELPVIKRKDPEKNQGKIRAARLPGPKPPSLSGGLPVSASPGRSVAGKGPLANDAIPEKGISASPKEGIARNTGRKKPRELPILRDESVELHAIAWSTDPAQRMAVVNEEILREGGSHSGYTVIRIDADEIILRKDQKEWRLPSR